jgi:hypothetical protein
VRAATRVVVMLVVLGGLAAGCAPQTPEQRAASQRGWAEREQERRAECARQGLRYFDGACLSNAF